MHTGVTPHYTSLAAVTGWDYALSDWVQRPHASVEVCSEVCISRDVGNVRVRGCLDVPPKPVKVNVSSMGIVTGPRRVTLDDPADGMQLDRWPSRVGHDLPGHAAAWCCRAASDPHAGSDPAMIDRIPERVD